MCTEKGGDIERGVEMNMHMHMYTCAYIYIYTYPDIEVERERDIDFQTWIYTYMYSYAPACMKVEKYRCIHTNILCISLSPCIYIYIYRPMGLGSTSGPAHPASGYPCFGEPWEA